MRKRALAMGLGLKSNGRKRRTRGTSHPMGKGGCYTNTVMRRGTRTTRNAGLLMQEGRLAQKTANEIWNGAK